MQLTSQNTNYSLAQDPIWNVKAKKILDHCLINNFFNQHDLYDDFM